jgi:hypothetical protein
LDVLRTSGLNDPNDLKSLIYIVKESDVDDPSEIRGYDQEFARDRIACSAACKEIRTIWSSFDHGRHPSCAAAISDALKREQEALSLIGAGVFVV